MKLCKVIEYNKGNMILQNYAENESETKVVYSNHYGMKHQSKNTNLMKY